MLRRYDPATIIIIPKNLVKEGISWIVNAAIIVVNTGLKEERGEIKEIGDKEIAEKDATAAIVSKIAEASIRK